MRVKLPSLFRIGYGPAGARGPGQSGGLRASRCLDKSYKCQECACRDPQGDAGCIRIKGIWNIQDLKDIDLEEVVNKFVNQANNTAAITGEYEVQFKKKITMIIVVSLVRLTSLLGECCIWLILLLTIDYNLLWYFQ